MFFFFHNRETAARRGRFRLLPIITKAAVIRQPFIFGKVKCLLTFLSHLLEELRTITIVFHDKIKVFIASA